MKIDKVAGSGNDEFYTPRYAIVPILKYLKKQPEGEYTKIKNYLNCNFPKNPIYLWGF